LIGFDAEFKRQGFRLIAKGDKGEKLVYYLDNHGNLVFKPDIDRRGIFERSANNELRRSTDV